MTIKLRERAVNHRSPPEISTIFHVFLAWSGSQVRSGGQVQSQKKIGLRWSGQVGWSGSGLLTKKWTRMVGGQVRGSVL